MGAVTTMHGQRLLAQSEAQSTLGAVLRWPQGTSVVARKEETCERGDHLDVRKLGKSVVR